MHCRVTEAPREATVRELEAAQQICDAPDKIGLDSADLCQAHLDRNEFD